MLNLVGLAEEVAKLDNGNNRNDWLKDYIKFPDIGGFSVIRLLAPRTDKDPFYFGVKRHKINGKNMQCLKKFEAGFWRGDCPICACASDLWKQSESPDLTDNQVKELRGLYSAIKGKERFFFNAIQRKLVDDKTGTITIDAGPLKLSANKDLKDLIIRAIIGAPEKNKKGLGDVTNESNGRDLNLVVSKNAGGFPDFGESEFLDPSPLHSDKKVIAGWMEKLHDLSAQRKPLTLDELQKEVNIFRGLESSPDTQFNPADFEPQPTKTVVKEVRKPVESISQMEMAMDAEDILRDLDIDNM